jgi:ABC transport system ATP-binding/permease protein
LLLARLFARPANVLVLDEPTNDLDIDTLELLESLLQDFAGTLFLVSHDRAFLENTVTQVIAFEGNGVLTEFGGGYDDWQRFNTSREAQNKTREQNDVLQANIHAASRASPEDANKNTSQNKAKLSFKEQQELDGLPNKIEQFETEQSSITAQLADADIYKNQPEKAKNMKQRLTEIEINLENLLNRWEALDAIKNSYLVK